MSQMERGILKSLGGLVRLLILCSIHGPVCHLDSTLGVVLLEMLSVFVIVLGTRNKVVNKQILYPPAWNFHSNGEREDRHRNM